MPPTDAAVQALSDTLIYEILNAIGLPKTRWLHHLFRPLFGQATDRLSAIGLTADRMIASDGFPSAAGWMASHWVRDVLSRGTEMIPPNGPLLVIANHVGAYDFLVIPSQLKRQDLAIIASDIPFLRHLPNASRHLIYLTGRTQDRMTAARAGIRHLRSGGTLLLFGSGLIDPDPAVYPGAAAQIASWSSSIDLFLRQVPQTRLLATIASGILTPGWAHHPITRLRKIDWQRRRLAEFGQVLQQLFQPGRLYAYPRVSFAPPVSVPELRRETDGKHLLPAVIARGRALLVEHVQAFGGYAT
ncbi:MAG: 1-acyl-sn-glycerol-3-phosphate acyltransferase [Anaerolineales bacterium]|nr:1-acyl-sn-glycerol-3-phosphate acyltransferase [Anaerolineales bacterium]